MIIAVLAEKMSEFLIKQYNATGDYRFEDAATLIDNQSTQITQLQAEVEALKTELHHSSLAATAEAHEVDRINKELKALRKDAARYQWLSTYLISDETNEDDNIINAHSPIEFDCVIDTAITKTTQEQ
jgi:wyosine [tRNA(Phe)-imidazoG37] synthetase (radical SAM superfamily)